MPGVCICTKNTSIRSSSQEYLPKDWIMVLLLHFCTWCAPVYLLKASGIAYEHMCSLLEMFSRESDEKFWGFLF